MCKGEKLKSITLNCIEKLQIQSGANVRAVVSDQGSNFKELVKSLGISAEKPYFIVNEKKFYYFYDVPHLIKSVRNNILQYDITFKDNKGATWKHIQAFYKSYECKPLRLAPKLTHMHINSNNFQKMRVKYAVQVFNESVAGGFSTFVSFKALLGGAAGTAEFLEKFDKLFDLFNSSKYRNAKQYNLAFMRADYQLAFL
ncbi:hypothetical protein ILUMI_14451 [Ignelater luminosus]|uniref:Transposable element P transposase-like GTP-binding insertion domain-containing protein n=1 Tax=Ignelater luminosus TaxID=2038154 RepID=A0A8K0CUS2_IGNLU|nr:hypothetical protein ILUMI_14451 [Ignelater luminosus]